MEGQENVAVGAGAGRLVRLVVALSAAVLLVSVAVRFSAASVWDDGYIFLRYADNVLSGQGLAFNPGGEPTYGVTALGYLGVVAPLRALLPGNPALVMVLASALCGLAFLVALCALLSRCLEATPGVKGAAIGLAFFSLAFAASDLATHFTSGMDTTFSLAYLTVYILLAKWHERERSLGSGVVVGLCGGLAFAARPDLLVFTLAVPAAMALFASDRAGRLRAAGILGLSLALVAAQVGLCALYFKSPLPLPFYAKTQGIYGPFIEARCRPVPAVQLCLFTLSYPYLFGAIAIAVAVDPRGWWRELSAGDRGLLLAVVLFIGWYLFFVLQIMAMAQRFYYPVLPALAFVAARSAAFALKRLGAAGLAAQAIGATPARRRLAVALGGLILLFSLAPRAYEAARYTWRSTVMGSFLDWDLGRHYARSWRGHLVGLDAISRLPDDLVLATSELGLPLALNPRKAVIDLAGLNERTIAHRGFSADWFFAAYRPDLIYLPHPAYREMIAQIVRHPDFLARYEHFPGPPNSAQMGVALRRDSRHCEAMRAIVVAEARWLLLHPPELLGTFERFWRRTETQY